MTRHRRKTREGHAGAYIPATVPRVALVAAVVCLVGIGGWLAMSDDGGKKADRKQNEKLIGLIVTTIPGLLALAYSERASKDIRNGTVVAKAKEGAKAAIEEAGPEVAKAGAAAAIQEEQVMTRNGPAITAELAALTELVLTGRTNGEALQSIAQSLGTYPRLTNPAGTADTPPAGPSSP